MDVDVDEEGDIGWFARPLEREVGRGAGNVNAHVHVNVNVDLIMHLDNADGVGDAVDDWHHQGLRIAPPNDNNANANAPAAPAPAVPANFANNVPTNNNIPAPACPCRC